MKIRMAVTAAMLILSCLVLGAQTTPAATQEESTNLQPATQEQVTVLEQRVRDLNATLAKSQLLQTRATDQARQETQRELAKTQAALTALSKQAEAQESTNRLEQIRAAQELSEHNRVERNRFLTLTGVGLILILGAFIIVRRIRKGQSMVAQTVIVRNDPETTWQKITAHLDDMVKNTYDPNNLLKSHLHIARLGSDPSMEAVKHYAHETGLNAFIVFSGFEPNHVFVPNIAHQVGDEKPKAYFTLKDFENRDRGGRHTTWQNRRGRASDFIVCKASPNAMPVAPAQPTYIN